MSFNCSRCLVIFKSYFLLAKPISCKIKCVCCFSAVCNNNSKFPTMPAYEYQFASVYIILWSWWDGNLKHFRISMSAQHFVVENYIIKLILHYHVRLLFSPSSIHPTQSTMYDDIAPCMQLFSIRVELQCLLGFGCIVVYHWMLYV